MISDRFVDSGAVRSFEQEQTVQWRQKDITPLPFVLMGAVAGGAMGSFLGPLGTLAGAVVGVAIGIIFSYFGYACAMNSSSRPNASTVAIQKIDEPSSPGASEPQAEAIAFSRESIPVDSPDPVVVAAKIWKAARDINDLSIPDLNKKELTQDEEGLIREVYNYCLDSKFANLVPQDKVYTVIAWVGKIDQKWKALLKDANCTKSQRFDLARMTIENDPKLKCFDPATKDILVLRLYNASFYMANPLEAVGSDWLTSDLNS